MLDWLSCQICYPLEIKILLLLLSGKLDAPIQNLKGSGCCLRKHGLIGKIFMCDHVLHGDSNKAQKKNQTKMSIGNV